ncbi:MAG: M3 family oligoendopeptidase [Acidimicrobiales bacterium]
MTDVLHTTTDSDDPLRWNTTAIFGGLDSPEFAAAHEALGADVTRLGALYEHHDVRASAEGATRPVTDEAAVAVDEVIAATNHLLDRLRIVQGYVYLHTTTDARHDRGAALESELRVLAAPLAPLFGRLDAWLAGFDADALSGASGEAADHVFAVARAQVGAAHQMGEAEEALAAELNLSGGSAWAQLHREVSARLVAHVERPGATTEALPIFAVRNLAYEADADRREAAYRAELAAWETVAVPLAAAMNGVKGQAVVLDRRRGWPDALAPALFDNAVERSTFDAMQAAVTASLPAFHRYLRAKARALGHADGRLPWWDLFAPLGDGAAAAVDWDGAQELVRRAFGGYSPALAALSDRAFAERWIDVEPRDGKTGGAFCMGVEGEVSRVLLNFSGQFDGVTTLAHELGHAYHNVALAPRTAIQRRLPMALAETASIFCETILLQAGLAEASGPEGAARRLVLLENDLLGATQVVVDIRSRFLFESAVFTRRAERALSVGELDELMLDAQRQAYGDALSDDLHPRMWAVKPHYYGRAFYNWPYTFGLLFGIGLYARYLDEPDAFRAGYDDLLSSTGLGTAAELAARFGIDVDDQAFWASSLAVLAHRVDDFEDLVAHAEQVGS